MRTGKPKNNSMKVFICSQPFPNSWAWNKCRVAFSLSHLYPFFYLFPLSQHSVSLEIQNVLCQVGDTNLESLVILADYF